MLSIHFAQFAKVANCVYVSDFVDKQPDALKGQATARSTRNYEFDVRKSQH